MLYLYFRSTTNCHPMCGECYTTDNPFGCSTISSGYELTFNVALCPNTGEYFSYTQNGCQTILTVGCSPICKGECFEANNEDECVQPCRNGKFLSSSVICSGKSTII